MTPITALIHRCVHFIVEDNQSNIIYLWQIHASYSQSPPPLCFQQLSLLEVIYILKTGGTFACLKLLGIFFDTIFGRSWIEWDLTMTSASILGCTPSGPMHLYGLKFLKRSMTKTSSTAGSSSPPQIWWFEATEENLLVKTEAKRAWSTSALPVSAITKSPTPFRN